jgi:phosphonate degradation associated HDIG domain protein
MPPVSVINMILAAFDKRGSDKYGEEAVTQLQHAVQCGHLAIKAGADDRLIAAALLHDVGHILDDGPMPDDCHTNLDDKHEQKGYQFLQQYFGPAVADPVRLHVLAKRYLCTADPGYKKQLSPTSLKSFLDQGGTMSESEMAEFESEPYYHQAMRLRHWDDTAKDPSGVNPPLTDFISHLEASLS